MKAFIPILLLLAFTRLSAQQIPDTAWVFNQYTRRMPAKNKSQGAFMEYGKGRIVFFGEAAMFSAQLAGPQKQKMGMNHPSASQNHQLLLNIVHWLDGIL